MEGEEITGGGEAVPFGKPRLRAACGRAEPGLI